ncbi:MAG: SpoIIIAH-like family protein [Clostridia bacterium]|nr:SpoIIIAH-like family protein [Clostridia bacterium]
MVENIESDEDLVENNLIAETENQTITTNANVDNYFTESKLTRDKMYSQMLESYQKILESSNVADSQKQIASQEIANINNKKNAIMIAENLIKNKGIEDTIIFINDKSISVIAKASNLSDEQIAQIQNIIGRELNAEADNIHISTKN